MHIKMTKNTLLNLIGPNTRIIEVNQEIIMDTRTTTKIHFTKIRETIIDRWTEEMITGITNQYTISLTYTLRDLTTYIESQKME